jgi:hypothetical protein
MGSSTVTLEYELVSSLFMDVSTILDERTPLEIVCVYLYSEYLGFQIFLYLTLLNIHYIGRYNYCLMNNTEYQNNELHGRHLEKTGCIQMFANG